MACITRGVSASLVLLLCLAAQTLVQPGHAFEGSCPGRGDSVSSGFLRPFERAEHLPDAPATLPRVNATSFSTVDRPGAAAEHLHTADATKTLSAASSCPAGEHTAHNLRTYVLSSSAFSLVPLRSHDHTYLLRVPLSGVAPYMPYFVNDKDEGLQQGLLDSKGFIADWAETAEQLSSSSAEKDNLDLYPYSGLAATRQCGSHIGGQPSIQAMMSSQSFSACARTKAPTNAMLALHGDEKASIVVDINHVSVDDKEAVFEVQWVPEPQLVAEAHTSCHPEQPLGHQDRHYHHVGVCGYNINAGSAGLSTIASNGHRGMTLFLKGDNACYPNNPCNSGTPCQSNPGDCQIEGSPPWGAICTYNPLGAGTACTDGAITGTCDGQGACVQAVANDPVITGFDGKMFNFDLLGDFVLLADGEKRKVEVTFSGTSVAESEGEDPKEKSWTSSVRLTAPNGDTVSCALPGITPNTSLVTVTAQEGSAAGNSPTLVTAASPTVKLAQMSAEAVLSWKEVSGVQYSQVTGCKVTTPKYVITVYQVSGWDEAQARPEEHGWAAPFTWLNLNLQMTDYLVGPVTGILGDTYPQGLALKEGQQARLVPGAAGVGGEAGVGGKEDSGTHMRKMLGPMATPFLTASLGLGNR